MCLFLCQHHTLLIMQPASKFEIRRYGVSRAGRLRYFTVPSHDSFPIICILFNFSHQCFIVFSVRIFHLLDYIYSKHFIAYDIVNGLVSFFCGWFTVSAQKCDCFLYDDRVWCLTSRCSQTMAEGSRSQLTGHFRVYSWDRVLYTHHLVHEQA